MGETTSDAAQAVDREIVATRLLDAPRELVFQMWTDPQHVVQWWGPNGFTNTIEEMDVRAGGIWRFVMHGPDGTDYRNKIIYVDVVKAERIVYNHVSGPQFQMIATFAGNGGKTELTVRMLFDSAAEREKVAKEFGAVEGLNQTLGRLEAKLSQMETAGRPFVILRTFDAPRDLVWKAWTERERLMQWFGPKGFTMPVATLDFRPGGAFHYCLRSPDGKEMWGKFVYREIVPPQWIVHVHSFADEKGNVTRHSMSPTWPLEMLSTTTLTEQDGKTTISVEWSALNPSEVEQKTFDAGHDGMTIGWSGTFDQLADYLAKA